MKKLLFFVLTLSSTAYSSINNEMYENSYGTYSSSFDLDGWYALSDRARREAIKIHLADSIMKKQKYPLTYALCVSEMIVKQLTRNEVKEYPVANKRPSRDRIAKIMSNSIGDVANDCLEFAK